VNMARLFYVLLLNAKLVPHFFGPESYLVGTRDEWSVMGQHAMDIRMKSFYYWNDVTALVEYGIGDRGGATVLAFH
jgi:hypothetical protein